MGSGISVKPASARCSTTREPAIEPASLSNCHFAMTVSSMTRTSLDMSTSMERSRWGLTSGAAFTWRRTRGSCASRTSRLIASEASARRQPPSFTSGTMILRSSLTRMIPTALRGPSSATSSTSIHPRNAPARSAGTNASTELPARSRLTSSRSTTAPRRVLSATI